MAQNHNKQIDEALDLIDSKESGNFVLELEKQIADVVEKTKDEQSAKVESAVDIIPSERSKFESILESLLKRKLDLKYSVNPSLLGGFRIKVGDWVLDASILNELESIKKYLGV